MPTAEEVLGITPEVYTEPDPPSFDYDNYIFSQVYGNGRGESVANVKESLASVSSIISRPWYADYYNGMSALNRGWAHMATKIDKALEYLSGQAQAKKKGKEIPSGILGMITGKDYTGVLNKVADYYDGKADRFRERAEEVGINYIDEVFSEALGGAVPGMADFALSLKTGLVYPYLVGAEEALQRGDNEFVEGIVEAGKTGTLGMILRSVGPLKQYLRTPLMFGIGTAQAKFEGVDWPEAVKSGAALALYDAMTPGGKLGINDLIENISKIQVPELLKSQRGAITIKEPPPEGKDVLTNLPPVKEGMVRFYHGGIPGEGSRFLTPDYVYAKGYADKTPGAIVQYVDIPEKSPLLQKAFEDVGASVKAPYISFEAPEEIMAKAKPILSGKEPPPEGKGIIKKAEQVEPKIDDMELVNKLDVAQNKINSIIKQKGYGGIKPYPELQEAIDNRQRVFEEVYNLKNPGRPVGTKVIIDGKEFTLSKVDFDTSQSLGTVMKGVPTGRTYEPTLTLTDKEGRTKLVDVKTFNSFETRQVEEKPIMVEWSGKEQGKDSYFQKAEQVEREKFLDDLMGGKKKPTEEPETKVKKFPQTMTESELVQEEPKSILKGMIDEGKFDYVVKPMEDAKARANEYLENNGYDKALEYAMSKEPLTQDKSALFNILIAKAQKDGDWDRFVNLVDAVATQAQEPGRAIQMLSEWSKSTPQGFLKWIERQLKETEKRYGFFDKLLDRGEFELTDQEKIDISKGLIEVHKITDESQRIEAIKDLIRIATKKVPPSISEMKDAYFYQNILSGPQTQERNIGENMFNTWVTKPTVDITKGMIDYVKSGLFGKAREDYVTDVADYYKGAINAVPNAINSFKAGWRLETKEIKPETGLEYGGLFEEVRREQMPKALSIVPRFMEASDRFNMELISSGQYAIDRKHGIDEVTAEQHAKDVAERYLYRNKLDPNDPYLSYPSKMLAGLGKIGEETRRMKAIGPISKWFLRFIRTPINKGTMMVEFSPLGFANSELFNNNEVMAKPIIGSLIGAIGAIAAYQGKTTWTPPTDPEEKEWFYATGRKPFSFEGPGGNWYPVWYLGPFAFGFSIPAAIHYYQNESKKSITEDTIEKIGEVSAGLTRFIASQTSLASMGNFFNYISGDVDYSPAQMMVFTAEQAFPASSLIRWTNKVLDPVYRHPEGYIEEFMKDIPFLSQELPERKTPYGTPSERDFLNAFVPYDIGIRKEEYEVMYPMKNYNDRLEYIQNKKKSLFEQYMKGGITYNNFQRHSDALDDAYIKLLERGIK